MSALNDLVNQVSDPELRKRIQQEIDKMSKQKKFGLVFEEHLPECTPLYDIPVKRGSQVAKKTGQVSDMYKVLSIKDGVASCLHLSDKEMEEIQVDELVCVAAFGEPIYPCLKKIDSICNAPDSDLWHTLIEADNYHALQLLEYLYAGKVDCIYIDPPYNTGARDWKYNNDYVDSFDQYRHSKWLSMMEKRLKLAKKLLCKDGVLVVAIDDYEEARLYELIEEIYKEYDVNTVIINHHPQGGAADNISRTHEYALFVTPKGMKLIKGKRNENLEEQWSLTRGGTDVRNLRKGRPNSFYAIYVDKSTYEVKGVGPHLDADTPYDPQYAPEGCIALYPVGRDGKERVWRYERESMRHHIEEGDIICTRQKTLHVVKHREEKYDPVFSVWTDGKYNAGTFGTNLIQSLFGDEHRFSYPKSLYTVMDCIKFSTQNKPNALIVDFFSGSGTTLHAVNLLNAADGGHRRCVMVTNNEVSDEESKLLIEKGIRPGDPEWETLGIARHVTWPRTLCSIKGKDINGNPLQGDYGCNVDCYEEIEADVIDPDSGKKMRGKIYKKAKKAAYPELANLQMANGFKANAAFFKLGFVDKTSVALGRQLKELFPVLWLKAGAKGPCPDYDVKETEMVVLPENGFAILLDERRYPEFTEKVTCRKEIHTVFIVTDSDDGYREMIKAFPEQDTYQLYKDYLDNFRINTER